MGEERRQEGGAAVRWLVRGRVQGVGFRWFVVRAARDSGITGDVRNLADGRVEVRARGASAALELLLAAIRRGPRGARVEGIDVAPGEPETPRDGFGVRS